MDIFDQIQAKKTGAPPTLPPNPAPVDGDIFDEIQAKKTAGVAASTGPLTLNNIPAGHVAMTGPMGDLQAIPHGNAAALMQKGWRLGPPQQQDPSIMQQAWQTGVADPLKMAAGLASETGSAVKGLATTAAQPPKGPAEMLSMLAGPAGPLAIRMGKGYVDATQENEAKAREAAEQGKSGKAFGYSVATGLPLFGPMVGRAMKIGEDVESGKMSGPESAGRGLSLVGQVVSGSPKVAGALGKIGGAVGNEALTAAKIKALPVGALNPAEQLAKTAGTSKMMAVHDAAKVALPDIQEAAAGRGQPIQTIEHAIDAAKQAKVNVAAEAQAKLDAQGGGKTLADAPEEYHAKVKAIDTLQDHLEDLADKKAKITEAAAKANKNVPTSRGQAAGVLAKGVGKSAVGVGVGEAINSVLPGGGTLARAGLDAAGLGAGGKDLAYGIRGLVKPAATAAQAAALDSAVEGAFKPSAQTGVSVPQNPIGPDPFAAPAGPVDPRIQVSAPPVRTPIWKQNAGAASVEEPAAQARVPVPQRPEVVPAKSQVPSIPETQAPASGFPKTAEVSSPNAPRSFATKNIKQMAAFNKSREMSTVRGLVKDLQGSLEAKPAAVVEEKPGWESAIRSGPTLPEPVARPTDTHPSGWLKEDGSLLPGDHATTARALLEGEAKARVEAGTGDPVKEFAQNGAVRVVRPKGGQSFQVEIRSKPTVDQLRSIKRMKGEGKFGFEVHGKSVKYNAAGTMQQLDDAIEEAFPN